MDVMQQQIQQTLVSNVLKDKCKNSNNVVFEESWSTQNRVVRFTTPFFRDLFEGGKPGKGKWDIGFFVMYEVKVSYDSWEAACVFNDKDMPHDQLEMRNRLLKACGVNFVLHGEDIVLNRWYSSSGVDLNVMLAEFDDLLSNKVEFFENQIMKHINEEDSIPDGVKEGEEKYVTLTTYERNPVARKKCLEAHGTACSVCGLDFGKVYGPQFAGKIEVHHIVPISQIGKEYIVDPVNDLIPVCPNCHTALHSKKGGGVYTVEELRKMMGK